MGRNEVENKLVSAISKLNMNGLNLIECLISNLEESEKYSINTSEERLQEIDQEEKAAREAEQEEYEQKLEHEYFERMRQEIEDRENKIQNLVGKEKMFWDKIEKVRGIPGFSRYCMSNSQEIFLADLYNNNLLNASYSVFRYGFYQGMQYMSNQAKKKTVRKAV